MSDLIEQNAQGWWVPAPASSVVARYQKAAEETLAEVYKHVRGWDLAVCAGAHVGVWPKMLAEKFKSVWSFEPDPVNYECAVRNLESSVNTVTYKRALSDESGEAPWARSDSNTGKHKIDDNGEETVRTERIDFFDFWPACDLITLDVEGYEYPALRGATGTVEKFRPVVLFEDIGHGKKYGFPNDAVPLWLEARGYREAARVHDDRIWIPT